MNPTHHSPTLVAVGEPTPADILRAAALYLQRHGWTQHRYYAPADTPTPPACAAGAIAMAAYGRRIDEPYDTVRPGWRACIDGWQPAHTHHILGPVYTRCPGCRQTCPCCHGDGLFAADTFCPGCLITLLADEHGLTPLFCHTCYGVLDLIPLDTNRAEASYEH